MLLASDGSWSPWWPGILPVVKLGPDGRVVETIGVGGLPARRESDGALAAPVGRASPRAARSSSTRTASSGAERRRRGVRDARLAAILSRRAGVSAKELVGSIAATLLEFLGRNPPDDDVSIAAIRRRMPAS